MMPRTTVVLVHDFHQSRFSLMTNLKGLSGFTLHYTVLKAKLHIQKDFHMRTAYVINLM